MPFCVFFLSENVFLKYSIEKLEKKQKPLDFKNTFPPPFHPTPGSWIDATAAYQK